MLSCVASYSCTMCVEIVVHLGNVILWLQFNHVILRPSPKTIPMSSISLRINLAISLLMLFLRTAGKRPLLPQVGWHASR